MDCIFCKIASGDIPAKKIAETGNSVAFMDAAPVSAGHCLVIPKNHYKLVQEIPGPEAADLFGLVQRLAPRVDGISGATLVAVHNGRLAGQEVPHVHVHLIPRGEGDSAGAVHKLFEMTPRPTPDQTEKAFKILSGV